ncbi:FabD/lysophospholipase-like protein [Phlegmacium glaucopus]|nr:FabD/lysophospholipase-like protein [Phlegmacium glaucopus]
MRAAALTRSLRLQKRQRNTKPLGANSGLQYWDGLKFGRDFPDLCYHVLLEMHQRQGTSALDGVSLVRAATTSISPFDILTGLLAFLVLSIDGGGFRGLSCLLILAHFMDQIRISIEEDITPKPCELFDLICGTSTGGLIAILLGRFGLSSDNGKIWGNIIHGEQFSSVMLEKKLEEIVVEYTGSKDTLFNPSQKDPASHDHTRYQKWGRLGLTHNHIRSYPRPFGDIDPPPYSHQWTIFEGARGTCAAPLYLSPLKIQKGHAIYLFQDAGASGFNNPSQVAIDEAEKIFGDNVAITLVSLGTGLRNLAGYEGKDSLSAKEQVKQEQIDSFTLRILDNAEQTRKNIKNARHLAKRIERQLFEVATDTEISHGRVYEDFKREGRLPNYFRFNDDRGLSNVHLTDCRQKAVIENMTNDWLRRPRKDTLPAIDIMKDHYGRRQRKEKE